MTDTVLDSRRVPAHLAEQLRALGSGFSLPQVQALYAPLLRAQQRSGVQVRTDQAYGPHERHRLDVYSPQLAASPVQPSTVLVCVHGGGFIRGDKGALSNLGYHFARLGLHVVVPNYRLAPEAAWPSGPQDVAACVRWLHAHGAALGMGPLRVVVLGESAGAAHVAAATLMARFARTMPPVRGVVLVSGPYNPGLEGLCRTAFGIPTPDPRNEAYFGSEPTAWADAAVVDHIDVQPLPLMVSFAERDLVQMQVQAGELFARLATRHGFAPELYVVPDHNHFSQIMAINTGDESLSGRILDFVRQHG
jgi:acetyl esterase